MQKNGYVFRDESALVA